MNKKEEIEKLINQIYKKKGFVDVVELANSLGLDVYATASDDPEFNASIEYDRNLKKYKILVNQNHHLFRQRFSIAHEIAHYLEHKKLVATKGFVNRENKSSHKYDQIEQQADKVAAAILLPTNILYRWVEKKHLNTELDEAQLDELCDNFRVSKMMAILRLKEIGIKLPYIAFA